ncbi:7866_t:CDS:1, partial [Gigaspora rosea]
IFFQTHIIYLFHFFSCIFAINDIQTTVSNSSRQNIPPTSPHTTETNLIMSTSYEPTTRTKPSTLQVMQTDVVHDIQS